MGFLGSGTRSDVARVRAGARLTALSLVPEGRCCCEERLEQADDERCGQLYRRR